MGDLTRLTAAEAAAAVASGETSAVDLTRAHLDRIAAVDDDVHAFLHVDEVGALVAAAAVDARRAAGEELGALAGVPSALKDVLCMEGIPTTCGSRILEGWRAAVRRDGHATPQGRRGGHPRQDEHGRVRDGLLHRALCVRADAQPVGPRPHPRRLRRGVGCRGGVLPGARGDRHRHRRLDPAARRRDGDRGREAHLRRGLAVRPRGARLVARPGWPVRPHGPRRGPAPHRDRRARPARLDLDRRAAAGPRRRRPPHRRPRSARRDRQAARR